MPALSLLNDLPPAELGDFQEALPNAKRAAKRLPLVRVAVSFSPARRDKETMDVLCDGWLKRAHKSPDSSAIEHEFSVANSLYFHGGRSHPDYGYVIVVISNTNEPMDATPFGLGGLQCDGAGTTKHDEGQCLRPVSHYTDIAKKKTFVHDSLWNADWRARTGEYLALYFGHDLSAYFARMGRGKPNRPDPEGIYSSPDNKDWRGWSVEVRVHTDMNLFDVLHSGHLICWAIDHPYEEDLRREALKKKIPLPRLYPLSVELPAARRISSPVVSAAGLFELVDEHVRRLVLS